MVAAGADEAIPMTVSCATPIASGSSRVTGAGMFPATAAADELATVNPPPKKDVPREHSSYSSSENPRSIRRGMQWNIGPAQQVANARFTGITAHLHLGCGARD